jgi:hypothetical protein
MHLTIRVILQHEETFTSDNVSIIDLSKKVKSIMMPHRNFYQPKFLTNMVYNPKFFLK